MAWLRLKAISVIAPKRAYFECFDQLIIWNSVAKALQSKKSKEDVKQAPERPNKELEITEDISKSLQLTPSSDDSFGLLVATEIKKLFPKKLSPKKKMKIKFEINNLLFTYQEDDDAAVVPQPPPIQAPPPIETYENTNTNLPSISLNERWVYDSLRKDMGLDASNN